jgi:hypothetical protein
MTTATSSTFQINPDFKLLPLPSVFNSLESIGVAPLFRMEHMRQYAMDCVKAYCVQFGLLAADCRIPANALPTLPKPYSYAQPRIGAPRSYKGEQMHQYAIDAISAYVQKLCPFMAA